MEDIVSVHHLITLRNGTTLRIEGRIEDTPIFRGTNPTVPSHVEANRPEPEPWLIAMTPEPSPDLANTAKNLFDYSHLIEDTRDLIESDKE